MLADAHNQAHYTTDYSTKQGETVGAGAMMEMGAGLERLHQEEGWDVCEGMADEQRRVAEASAPLDDGEESPTSVLGDADGDACEEDEGKDFAGDAGCAHDGTTSEGCAGAGWSSGKGKQQPQTEDGEAPASEVPRAPRRREQGGPRMTRRAYRTLVRLETAAHRAKHKGLCEMCFTALAGHECFASHDTWKLETKPAMWKMRSANTL